MDDREKRLTDIEHRESWIQSRGASNVEFSHLLDLFRDERDDVAWLLNELQSAWKREAVMIEVLRGYRHMIGGAAREALSKIEEMK